MSITIRRGIPADARALAGLAARTFRDAFAVMIADEQERRCAVRIVLAHGRDFIGIEQEG